MVTWVKSLTVKHGLITAAVAGNPDSADLSMTGPGLIGRGAVGAGAAGVVTVGSGLALSSGGVLSSTVTPGTGTVTTVSVVTANGVSGTVANPTTTPAITLTLGAITPTSVTASGSVAGSNLSGTNTGDQTITLTGDVTGTGTGSFVTTVAAGAITYGKIQNVTTNRLLGRSTAGSGPVEEISLGSGLSMSGGALSAAGGTGTVTSVSVVNANGFSGTVATQTTTPAVTISTTITGILKGNGASVSAAVPGTDYLTSNQAVTLTGDVTGTGTTAVAATISTGSVTDAKGALTWKPLCRAVATANIASLVGDSVGGGPTIDGLSLFGNDLVLLTGQTTASQNGPWVVGAGSANWTRPVWYPANGTTQAFVNTAFFIYDGNALAGTFWRCTTSGAITVGTTATAWSQVALKNASLLSSTITVTAGTGLFGGGVISLGGGTTISLPNVGAAGTYGQVTTDAQGRVTGGATTDVAHGGTGVTTLTGYVKGNGTAGMTASATVPATDLAALNALTAGDVSGLTDVVPEYSTGLGANRGVSLDRVLAFLHPSLFEFRLSLTSGDPAPAADQTAKATLYLTPALNLAGATRAGSARLCLYDGTRWKLYTVDELSLAASGLTAGSVYDVFLYDNAGTLTLELLAWTSTTARATALDLQDGVLMKHGALTRRYVGTVRATGAATLEDSLLKRRVWNMYNRRRRKLYVADGTGSWTYTTFAYRQANANAANQVDLLVPVSGLLVFFRANNFFGQTAFPSAAYAGIGEDSTTVDISDLHNRNDATVSGAGCGVTAEAERYPSVGAHYYAWLEQGSGSGVQTWFGAGQGTGLLGWTDA